MSTSAITADNRNFLYQNLRKLLCIILAYDKTIPMASTITIAVKIGK